jgi:hypothetical protein
MSNLIYFSEYLFLYRDMHKINNNRYNINKKLILLLLLIIINLIYSKYN